MAFTPINSSLISAGEPVRQELWTIAKDNFDDLDSRVTTTEGSLNAFLPIEFILNGQYSNYGTITGAL